MEDKSKILDKIKKCMALSSSSNEHEAAAALRQARKLMEANGISDLDVKAHEVSEQKARSGASQQPANWESCLSGKIARTFGCRVIFATQWSGWHGSGYWKFIGCGSAPEIAQYAFTVLLRQIKRARADHIKSALKRCKTATKTRRADLFCEGWVQSVAGLVDAFAGDERTEESISSFMEIRYPDLVKLDSRDRNAGRNLRNHELTDFDAGALLGRNTQLNRGVGGEENLKLGGV